MDDMREIINVVHYTKEKDFQIRQTVIKNAKLTDEGGYWCKPIGGIWASPVGSTYGWREWFKGHREFENIDEFLAIEMEVDIGKFIIIDSAKDLDKLHWNIMVPGTRIEFIDFEKLYGEGIEGIYLTKKGEITTRFPYIFGGKFRNLYGWDCETVLILNEKCIKSWRKLT